MFMKQLFLFVVILIVVVCFSSSTIFFVSAAAAAASSSSEISNDGVNVFTRKEGQRYGYFCIKIPYLFTTIKGTLIAFGEARRDSCSDFASTDLVFKRSFDNGKTWTHLKVFYSNSSVEHNISNVIGNAGVVSNRWGRIIVPFCRNNLEVYQLISDDDGETWKSWDGQVGVADFVPQGNTDGSKFLGVGPPGGLLLQSARIVIPCYHQIPGEAHSLDGFDTRDYLLLNDEDGKPSSYYVGGKQSFKKTIEWTNENQCVELEKDHLYCASRGMLFRLSYESFDGGETLTAPTVIDAIPTPLDGCEGSIIFHRPTSTLFFSDSITHSPLRYNMSIYTASVKLAGADNNNKTEIGKWTYFKSIDRNRTAYSSMIMLKNSVQSVVLLYEKSDLPNFIFLPTSFSFVSVYP